MEGSGIGQCINRSHFYPLIANILQKGKNWSEVAVRSSGGDFYLANAKRYGSYSTEWKKWSHFDLQSWVTGRTKIRSGIPSNCRIFESIWLDIESQLKNRVSISSQFHSNIVQLLGIVGRILVPPVTQLFRSKWLYFIFQCIWARESQPLLVSCKIAGCSGVKICSLVIEY